MDINESDLRTILDTRNVTVVALFGAKWCGPCRIFSPIFAKTGENFEPPPGNCVECVDLKNPDSQKDAGRAGAVFVKLDVDECTQLCEDINVVVVPTVVVFKNSKVFARKDGGFASGGQFLRWLGENGVKS